MLELGNIRGYKRRKEGEKEQKRIKIDKKKN